MLKTSRDLARKIAQKGAVAAQAALRAIMAGMESSLDEGSRVEMEQFAAIALSADAREGVSAFLQKRQPNFQDK